MSVSRHPEPDAIGPWAIVVGEGLEGVRPVVSAYGPMQRSGVVPLLEGRAAGSFDLAQRWAQEGETGDA